MYLFGYRHMLIYDDVPAHLFFGHILCGDAINDSTLLGLSFALTLALCFLALGLDGTINKGCKPSPILLLQCHSHNNITHHLSFSSKQLLFVHECFGVAMTIRHVITAGAARTVPAAQTRFQEPTLRLGSGNETNRTNVTAVLVPGGRIRVGHS